MCIRDSFHAAGKAASLPEVWKLLKEEIAFGDITNFNGNTYLGCTQVKVDVPETEVQEKHDRFNEFLKSNTNQTAQDFVMKPIKPTTKKTKPKKKAKPSVWDGEEDMNTKLAQSEDEEVSESFMMTLQTADVNGWYYQMAGALKDVLNAIWNWPRYLCPLYVK